VTEKKETYRCNVCGSVVEAEGEEKEELTCCGELMVKVEKESEKEPEKEPEKESEKEPEKEPEKGGGCCEK